MSTTRILPALTLFALLGCATSNSTRETENTLALDGTRWKVEVVPDAAASAQGESAFEDWLIFENGRMTSSFCAGVGFRPTAYTVHPDGSGWSFETAQHADGAGDTQWHGTIRGQHVEGNMQITHPGKSAAHSSFSGQKGTANG